MVLLFILSHRIIKSCQSTILSSAAGRTALHLASLRNWPLVTLADISFILETRDLCGPKSAAFCNSWIS